MTATVAAVRRPIRVLHVPKAAGTSLAAAIRTAAIDAGERSGTAVSVCPQVMDSTLFGSFDSWDGLSPERRAMIEFEPERLVDYDLVAGHFCLDHLALGHGPSDVVTVLREPRTRLLSLYAYWRSWSAEERASWAPYDVTGLALRPLEAMLSEPSAASQTDNVAARLLLGAHPLIPPDDFIAAEDVARVTSDALARLASLGHVDLVEAGDDCWNRIGSWTGLDLEVGHRNITEQGAPIADLHRAAPVLRARSSVDLALWVAAASRYADGVSSATLLRRADDVFRRRQGQLSPTRARIAGGLRRAFRRRVVR